MIVIVYDDEISSGKSIMLLFPLVVVVVSMALARAAISDSDM